ncbi:MAG: hypothetical protein ACI4VF_03240, partial [Lachnospirales bacterium]
SDIEYQQDLTVYIAYKNNEIVNAFKLANKISEEGSFVSRLSDIGSGFKENMEYANKIDADVFCYIDNGIKVVALENKEHLAEIFKNVFGL